MWPNPVMAVDILGLLLCAGPGLLLRHTQNSPMAGKVVLGLMLLFSAIDSVDLRLSLEGMGRGRGGIPTSRGRTSMAALYFMVLGCSVVAGCGMWVTRLW